MFLLRNKKDISIFWMKKAPYLLLYYNTTSTAVSFGNHTTGSCREVAVVERLNTYGLCKGKTALEHSQNTHMGKVSAGPLLFSHSFCSIQ